MSKTAKEKIRPEEEVAKSPITGTFFDTFEFSSKEVPGDKTKEEEEEALKKAKEEETAKKAEEEEARKKAEEEGKTPEEIEAEQKAAEEAAKAAEELEAQIEATYKAIKAKDEKDLDDEDKKFLEDYDAGNLKDYKATEDPKKEESKEGFDTLTKSLIDKGVLAEVDEIEDSEDGFKDVVSKTIESRVEEWINKIPEEYRNVIDHMQNGGDINQYLQSRQRIDYDNLDYKNPQIQEALVRANLAEQGYSQEDIDEKIIDLKDLEKIEKEATIAGKIFAKAQEDRIKAEDAKIAEATRKAEEAAEKEVEEISNSIDKMDEIVGFKLTKNRKEAFKKYLFEVGDDGETAASRASKDNEKRIKLYFMDFIDYNFDDLKKSVETKKTRDLSKILNRYKDAQTKPKGTSVSEKKKEEPVEFELKLPSMFGGAPTDE